MLRGWILLIGSLALGGCEGIKVEEAKYKEVPSAERRILLYTEHFAGVDPRVHVQTITYAGHRREWVVFKGNGHQAEILLSEAGPGYYWTEFVNKPAGDYVTDWPYFKSRTIKLGSKGNSPGPLGATSYQRFQHSDSDCVSLMNSFSPTVSDRGGGPIKSTKFIIGYFCNKPGEVLSEERIKAFISGLGIRGEKEPTADLKAKFGRQPAASVATLGATAPAPEAQKEPTPIYCYDSGKDIPYIVLSGRYVPRRCVGVDKEITKVEYERLQAAKPTGTTPPQVPSGVTATEPRTKAAVEKRLEELKQLLDKGLITPDEAARKRREILDSL
jgi:hypothetical protein